MFGFFKSLCSASHSCHLVRTFLLQISLAQPDWFTSQNWDSVRSLCIDIYFRCAVSADVDIAASDWIDIQPIRSTKHGTWAARQPAKNCLKPAPHKKDCCNWLEWIKSCKSRHEWIQHKTHMWNEHSRMMMNDVSDCARLTTDWPEFSYSDRGCLNSPPLFLLIILKLSVLFIFKKSKWQVK